MVKKLIFLLIILSLMLFSDNSYSKDKIVAVILASNISKFKTAYAELEKKIKEHKKDSQIQLILSTPNPDPSSWANAIKRAEGMDVDVIVAFGAPIAHTAVREKISVPLIYVDVYEKEIFEPKKGQKITGIYNNIPITTVINHLMAIKSFKTLHVLYNPIEKESEVQAHKILEISKQSNFKAELHGIRNINALTEIKINFNDAIFLTSSVVLETGLAKLAQYAVDHSVPLVGISDSIVYSGGLMCVAPDPNGQGKLLSEMLIKFLDTKNFPTSTQVKDVNFIINLNTAKKINLPIPFSVLNNATKVIK